MYVCMYAVCLHAFMCVHVCSYANVVCVWYGYVCVCVNVSVYVCSVLVHVCVNVSVYVCSVSACVYVCAHV